MFAISAELQKSDYVRGERERDGKVPSARAHERAYCARALQLSSAAAAAAAAEAAAAAPGPNCVLLRASVGAARFFIRVMREKDIEIKKEEQAQKNE